MTVNDHRGGFHESDEFARGIFDALAEGVLVVDHRGRVVAMNPSAENLLGYDSGKLIGVNVLDSPWILETERQRHLTSAEWPIVITMGTGEPCGRLVVTQRPDGERRIMVMIAMPLPRPDEKQWTVVSLMDVTRERRAELALAASESRFRRLVEQAPDPVLVVDANGLILSCNQRTGMVFGYDCGDLVGQPIELLVPEAARHAHRGFRDEFLESPVGRAMGAGAELSGRRGDGTSFPIEVSLGPIDTSEGPGVVAIARDLTERRHAQELVQVDRAKSEFLSRMSHELRTPLNSILGFAQLLEIAGPRRDQLEAVEQIQHAGRHLLDLLNDLLEFERVRSGHVTYSIELVSVTDAIAEALRLVEPAARVRGITLSAAEGAASDVWAFCDRQRLRQVLLNLLSNAIKYNRPAGRVTVGTATESDRVVVSVTDTGLGIPTANRNQLFVPFERLGAEMSETVEGTGVGLALTKMLVEGMRGSIEVDSEEGVGSCFSISLPPAEPPTALRDLVPRRAAGVLGDELREVSVLCIEDNDANVRVIQAMLAMFGVHRTFVANTAVEGIALAQRHRPDAVLLDLHLPDISGEVVVEKLGADARTESLPIIVITADANPETTRRLLASGIDQYLTKPVDVRELFEALVAATS